MAKARAKKQGVTAIIGDVVPVKQAPQKETQKRSMEVIIETVGTMVSGARVMGRYVTGSIHLATGSHVVTITQYGLPPAFLMSQVFVSMDPEGDQSSGSAGSGSCYAYLSDFNTIVIDATVATNSATISWIGVSE